MVNVKRGVVMNLPHSAMKPEMSERSTFRTVPLMNVYKLLQSEA